MVSKDQEIQNMMIQQEENEDKIKDLEEQVDLYNIEKNELNLQITTAKEEGEKKISRPILHKPYRACKGR